MGLTRPEKERLSDSRLRIQAVVSALEGIDAAKVPRLDEIDDCLKDADESLRQALKNSENHGA